MFNFFTGIKATLEDAMHRIVLLEMKIEELIKSKENKDAA